MRSISRRLIASYLTIGLFTLIILETLFIVAISQYYIGGMERALMNSAEKSAVDTLVQAP